LTGNEIVKAAQKTSVKNNNKNSNIYEGVVTKILTSSAEEDISGAKYDENGNVLTKATGVQFLDPKTGKTFELKAKKEVIMAAGVIGTPKILQLSGVGDRIELETLGIPVVKDIPDVGLHLQEHVGVSATARTNL